MKAIQQAKEIYAAAELLTEVIDTLYGEHEGAVNAAFERATGLSAECTQRDVDKLMNERAAAVMELTPIEKRIAELEDALRKVRDLAQPHTIRRNARIQALVARVV